MPAHSTPTANPLFDNSRLITPTGQIDTAFIAASAEARVASLYGEDAGADDIEFWTEKLTGMAEALRSQHIRNDTHRRLAVSALIGHCDAVCSSGVLTEHAEQSMRILIVATERAFGFERVL